MCFNYKFEVKMDQLNLKVSQDQLSSPEEKVGINKPRTPKYLRSLILSLTN